MNDFVRQVIEFNEVVAPVNQFDARRTALYIGLQLEEMAEKLEALNSNNAFLEDSTTLIKTIADHFKRGVYDHDVENMDRVAALDADVDLAVVALGGACAMGADVQGACNEVMQSNLSKFPFDNGKRVAIKDANGKVVKGPGYFKPNLEPYL